MGHSKEKFSRLILELGYSSNVFYSKMINITFFYFILHRIYTRVIPFELFHDNFDLKFVLFYFLDSIQLTEARASEVAGGELGEICGCGSGRYVRSWVESRTHRGR